MNLTHAFKTGLAAFLAAAIYLALNLPNGFWAVVSAVVVMQANIGASFKASWYRFLGTCIGAVIGAALVSLARHFFPVVLDASGQFGPITVAFGAGAAVALTGALCMLLRLKDAYRLAGVTSAIVLLVFAETPWESALHRSLDVTIGIVVALAVTLFVLPSRARHQLYARLGEVLADAGALCVELTKAYLVRDYLAADVALKRDAMKQKFRDSRALLAEAQNEPGGLEPRAQELFTQVERVLEHVLSLDQAARACDPTPDAKPLEREDELHRQISLEVFTLSEAISESCKRASEHLKNPKPHGENLGKTINDALAKLNERTLELRQAGASRKLPLEEVARFYTFIEALKALGRDVAIAACR